MQVHFTFFPFFTAAIAVRNVRASILRQMNFHQYEHFISRRKYLYHSSNNTGVTLLIKSKVTWIQLLRYECSMTDIRSGFTNFEYYFMDFLFYFLSFCFMDFSS